MGKRGGESKNEKRFFFGSMFLTVTPPKLIKLIEIFAHYTE